MGKDSSNQGLSKPKKNKFFSLDDEPKVQHRKKKFRNKLDLNKFHQVKNKKKIRVKSVKQKLRDIERGVQHKGKTGVVDLEEQEKTKVKVKELHKVKASQRKATFTDKKYEKIKMIEKKKIRKQLKKAQDEKAPDIIIKSIQAKLNYIKLYPKGAPYISVVKDESELSDFAKKKKAEILKAAGEQRTEQLKRKLDIPFEQENPNKRKKRTKKDEKKEESDEEESESEEEESESEEEVSESEDNTKKKSKRDVTDAEKAKLEKKAKKENKKAKKNMKQDEKEVAEMSEDEDFGGVDNDDFFM